MLLATLTAWDATACRTLNRTNHRWVGAGFRGISRLGNGSFWCALIVALPLVHGVGALRTSVSMLAAGAAATLLYRSIKLSTRRLRPCEAQPGIHLTELPLDRFSFPSGHTLHAVCFSTIACAAYPAWAMPLWTFTALVAASRLVLGLHYPSDVACGAILGFAVAHIALLIVG